MNPIVILDANALHTPRVLQSKQWKWLVDESNKGNLDIGLPRVVELELERQWKNRAIELREKIDSAKHELSRYVEASDAPDALEASRGLIGFREMVGDCDIKILDIPEVPHGDLLGRDLAKVKPFSSDGRGYRDSLIWHSIIEHVAKLGAGADVHFISNNKNDFAKDGELHPDLKIDIPDGCVILLHKSVWDFQEKFKEMLQERFKGDRSDYDEMLDARREFDFDRALERHISAELESGSIEDLTWLDIDSFLEEVEAVDHVVQFVEEHLVESLDDNTAIYSVEFEVDVTFRALVDIENYHEVSSEVELVDSSPDPQYVIVSFEEQAGGTLDMRLEADRETYEFI